MTPDERPVLSPEQERRKRIDDYLAWIASPQFEPCPRCQGRGYHHGFGENGTDPDWCESCGGPGEQPTQPGTWSPDDLLAEANAALAAKDADLARVTAERDEAQQVRHAYDAITRAIAEAVGEGDPSGPYWEDGVRLLQQRAEFAEAEVASLRNRLDNDASDYQNVIAGQEDMIAWLRAQLAEAREAKHQLLTALETAVAAATVAYAEWDADHDSRVGKLLKALSGCSRGYRADIDEMVAILHRHALTEAEASTPGAPTP